MIIGQTHSLSTHNKYYDRSEAYRKRKYDEGRDIQQTFKRITNRIEIPTHDSTVQVETNQPSPRSPPMMAQSIRQNQDNYQLLQAANYRLSTNPLPEQTQAMNEMDFGLARKDIEKDAKRFDWIEEELNYLEHYILDIEADSDKKNRFAVCLQHIRTEAPSEVKQYFHPHHLANSDRLKNGYNAAMKRLDRN